MARPRNFSREGVLKRALPVFWKHGLFADASLQELEKGYRSEQIRPLLEFFGQGGAVFWRACASTSIECAARVAHGRAPGVGQHRAVLEAGARAITEGRKGVSPSVRFGSLAILATRSDRDAGTRPSCN